RKREEAYSDWLEWVVQQAKAPYRVFRLFGLEPPSSLTDDAPLDVKREVCIPHGHEDQEGRLDLVISFGGQAAIIVEVKKGDADDADTAKHAGYTESHSNAKRVLLAVSAEELDYEGFEFRSWANVCIEMRLLAMELCKDRNTLAAAMVLAFVAAVEQNLLGFSAVSEKLVFVNTFVVDHIKHFLEKVER
ncbi:MAG TPA: hypothetical protein VE131_09770, partial [Terriglobales bacterium]|nr:hypothetical protein [Terriglobales bacterium]